MELALMVKVADETSITVTLAGVCVAVPVAMAQ
jgi:hypothetical protein